LDRLLFELYEITKLDPSYLKKGPLS